MFLIYAGGVVLPLALAYGAVMPRNRIEPSQLKVQEEGAGPVDTGKELGAKNEASVPEEIHLEAEALSPPTHHKPPTLSPVRYSPFAGSVHSLVLL